MSPLVDVAEVVRELLARAPEWVRVDLASKDAMARARAEETLAAMIEAALMKNGTAASGRAALQTAGDRE